MEHPQAVEDLLRAQLDAHVVEYTQNPQMLFELFLDAAEDRCGHRWRRWRIAYTHEHVGPERRTDGRAHAEDPRFYRRGTGAAGRVAGGSRGQSPYLDAVLTNIGRKPTSGRVKKNRKKRAALSPDPQPQSLNP